MGHAVRAKHVQQVVETHALNFSQLNHIFENADPSRILADDRLDSVGPGTLRDAS